MIIGFPLSVTVGIVVCLWELVTRKLLVVKD